jgi:hypothetical protein
MTPQSLNMGQRHSVWSPRSGGVARPCDALESVDQGTRISRLTKAMARLRPMVPMT